MAEKSYNDILSLNTDWGLDESNNLPYAGQKVQEFIKGELRKRYGYISIPTSKGEDGYYHILCFMSEADYNAYMGDPETFAGLLLQDVAIPIVTDTGVRYTARLTTDTDGSLPIVSVTPNKEVGFRFSGIQTQEGESLNAGIAGTITVQRSADGGSSWTQVGSFQLPSRDTSDTNYDTIDIGQYFGPTNPQQLRFRASYVVLDDDGNIIATAQSTWITFSNIVYTQIGLRDASDYEQPILAASANGAFPLAFNLMGEVARTLHVKIRGSKGEGTWTFAIGAGEYTNILSTWSREVTDDTDRYGLFTHGVKYIEAWLTCSDGVTADAIESEHITVQRMVVADISDTTPRLLIQNLATEVVNYVSGKICDYAVYAPGAVSAPVNFRITNYQDTENYLNLETSVVPGTRNSLDAAIEIENSVNDELFVYFRAEKEDGSQYIDPVTITVDNRDKFAPTSGAAFLLNPKSRNNSESNPFSIINAMTGKELSGSTFENFGAVNDLWMQAEDGQRVMRVLAGQKVTIDWDWLAPFANNNATNVTMEFDLRVRNVTDEDTPVLDASEAYGSNFLGLRLKPLEGALFTKKNVSHEAQNFGISEDARTHISVNILSGLRSTADTPDDKLISVCRVFINGNINREFIFDKNDKVWYDRGSKIVIGQEHADIDIYSIRIYNNALSADQIRQNRTVAFPTAEEKRAYRKENDLLGGNNLVNLDKCIAKNKNCLIWHGEQPTHESPAKRKGWWEIYVYNEDGTLNRGLSGTICKATASLEADGQGTTAKTYFFFNIQTKLKDVEDTIIVAPDKIARDYVDDYLGGVRPAAPIEVVDGFVDMDGMYHGPRWRLSDKHNWAQKLVDKINYASSMQSHIIGGNNLYNDLHTAIVGRNSLQLDSPKARVSKPLEPFLYFTQADDNATAVFQGPCAFGPGKMDDGNSGFNKKKHPNFCMMEGADNNLVLTDFRTPWESQYISYEIEDGEAVGFKYQDSVSLDLDKFVAAKETIGGVEVEVPNATVLGKIKEFVNFFYNHDPRISVYIGPWRGTGGFLASSSANENTRRWWCTEGDEAFKLKRWHQARGEWVDAGWDANTEAITERNLRTEFPDAYSQYAGQWNALNDAFIAAIAAQAKASIGNIVSVKSLQFHYCFVNAFLAGTDNNSKNTYYVLDPVTLKWEFWQDDLDTIFATDNSGRQTKPYYIDRLHPAKEGTSQALYEGMANALFNLEEAMYEASGENIQMFKQIFDTMPTLVSENDNIPWIDSQYKKSLWGCMWKYFFFVQKYFSAVVYNEAARIRYEYPKSLGYVSDRNVDPITQSMGDQLQNEMQYMKRRIIYFASYAGWGGFGVSGGSIGLDGANDVLGIQAYPDINGNNAEIKFTGLVPHQYMYIGGRVGQSPKYLGTRCQPGQSYDFDLTGGAPVGDTACALFGSNYFREFGNLGYISVNPNNSFAVNAKRLVGFTSTATDGQLTNFRPTTLSLNTPLMERLDLNGSAGIGGALDLTASIRLRSIDTRGCAAMENITLPESRMLTSVRLGANLISLTARNLPNLEALTAEGYSRFRSVDLESSEKLHGALKTFAIGMYNAQPGEFTNLRIDGVDWTGLSADVLMWMAGVEQSTVTGKIATSDARVITFSDKVTLINRYGDVDSPLNPLHVTYALRAINSLSIQGEKDLHVLKDYDMGLKVLPASGNNLASREGRPAITFSLVSAASPYASVVDPVEGIIHVHNTSDPALKEMFELSVAVELMDGTTMKAAHMVRFYRRIPEIGDFAWSDGTFDSQFDPSKEQIGIVFKKDDRYNEDGDLIGYRYRVLARENVLFKSTDAGMNTSYMPWGLYQADNENGFPAEMMTEICQATNLASATDTSVPNTSYTQWTSPYTITPERYRDADREDGYKKFTDGAPVNFNGKDETERVINHADAIILSYLDRAKPTTITELCDAMRELMTANNEDGRYRQFYYPAAYGCKLYEPNAETLHEQYRKGNWYLPSIGELMRVYNFFLASAGDVAQRTPTSAYANEAPQSEAATPIFANMLKKTEDAGGSSLFLLPTLSDYWCSSEYNSTNAWYVHFHSGHASGGNRKSGSHYVRAVAAFDFEL